MKFYRSFVTELVSFEILSSILKELFSKLLKILLEFEKKVRILYTFSS